MNKRKKLTLNRETLRALTAQQESQVAGGSHSGNTCASQGPDCTALWNPGCQYNTNGCGSGPCDTTGCTTYELCYSEPQYCYTDWMATFCCTTPGYDPNC